MSFDLHFGETPPLEPGRCPLLALPPVLRLAGPEHGGIDLIVDAPGHRFDTITLSDVYPPLADLWCWSLAVAWGLLPVAVPLDAEATSVWLWAGPLDDGRLQFGLMRAPRRMPIGKAQAPECLRWQETRPEFLRRWGRMWGAFLSDESFDETQWEEDPEPMRDMPHPCRARPHSHHIARPARQKGWAAMWAKCSENTGCSGSSALQ